jgi:RNA polymerase sigma-70 factor (ECF subfamily)
MADFPRDSIIRAPALTGGSERRTTPSSLEIEVVKLFDQLRGGLLRYILHFGLPLADGEEIVQETFLALFRHLRDGKPDDNLRGWVFRVAHNLALKRRAASRSDEAIDDRLFADAAPNPEDQAANRQRRTRLLAVLRALPEQDRRCLYLRAEGLRYREIASTLGMSLGAVSLSLGRSLARLGRADQR